MSAAIERSPDFIEVFENALSPELCQQLITAFEGSGRKLPGEVGGGVMKDLKDSDDILVSGPPEWRQAENLINEAIFPCLLTYLRRHAYVVLAPLMLQKQSPDGKRVQLDAGDIASMAESDLAGRERSRQSGSHRIPPRQDQYPAISRGQGRLPVLALRDLSQGRILRGTASHLAVDDLSQRRFRGGRNRVLLITPKRGAALIAPSGFTHTHRGNTPKGGDTKGGDKYIATSWILFQRAEVLFAKK